MPKFSIIIPVYNVEKYIEKCLNSVKKQSYKDFEVIIVNDGTEDNSIEKIKKYPVKIINQKNQGLSAARNRGIEEVKGEYLLFLDSDDYLEKDLLKELSLSLANSPDLVRFQLQEIEESTGKIRPYQEEPFTGKTGVEAFERISKYHCVESACLYLYKTSFYKKNHFQFRIGTYHEDFGLVPLIIMKAEKVNSISYIGYNYLQRKNSIMSSKSNEKIKKKVLDMFNHYLYLKTEIDKTDLNSKQFKSFIANSLILKVCELPKKEYQKYKKELKKLRVYDDLLTDTFPRKVKKIALQISPKLTKKILK